MITPLLNEMQEVWSWITGLVAGLGLTVSLLIIVILALSLKTTKISSRLRNLENRVISMDRDISLQINRIESSK
jgi:hypothetical protein